MKTSFVVFMLVLTFFATSLWASQTYYDGQAYGEIFFLSNSGTLYDPNFAKDQSHCLTPLLFTMGNNYWSNPKVAGKAGPGDLVVIMENITGTQYLNPYVSGLPGSPITITGALNPNGTVPSGSSAITIRIAAVTTGNLIPIFNIDRSYITWKNFTIQDPGPYSLYSLFTVEADGANVVGINVMNVIANQSKMCNFWVTSSGTGSPGFPTPPTSGHYCDNIVFINCVSNQSASHGFHVTQNQAPNAGVWFWNCKSLYSGKPPNAYASKALAAHGFDAYGDSFAQRSFNVHWRYCEAAYTNQYTYSDPSQSEGMGFFFDGFTSNSDMLGCYSHDNDTEGFGASSGTTYDMIAFCLSVHNGGGGIATNGLDYAKMYNNTSYNNGWSTSNGYRGGIVLTFHNHADIENNICVDNAVWGIYLDASTNGANKTILNNDCYGNPTNYSYVQPGGIAYSFSATNRTFNPLFTDKSGTGLLLTDFTLQTRSPAVGSGNPSIWQGKISVLDIDQNPVTNAQGNVLGSKVNMGAVNTQASGAQPAASVTSSAASVTSNASASSSNESGSGSNVIRQLLEIRSEYGQRH